MSVFSHFTRNKFFFHFFTHMHMALWFKWSCMNRKYIHKIIIIHKTNILNINNSTNGVIWDSIPVIIQLCLASSFDFWLLNVHNNKGNCREGEDDDNKGSFLLKLSEKMWKGIFCLNTQKKSEPQTNFIKFPWLWYSFYHISIQISILSFIAIYGFSIQQIFLALWSSMYPSRSKLSSFNLLLNYVDTTKGHIHIFSYYCLKCCHHQSDEHIQISYFAQH